MRCDVRVMTTHAQQGCVVAHTPNKWGREEKTSLFGRRNMSNTCNSWRGGGTRIAGYATLLQGTGMWETEERSSVIRKHIFFFKSVQCGFPQLSSRISGAPALATQCCTQKVPTCCSAYLVITLGRHRVKRRKKDEEHPVYSGVQGL